VLWTFFATVCHENIHHFDCSAHLHDDDDDDVGGSDDAGGGCRADFPHSQSALRVCAV